MNVRVSLGVLCSGVDNTCLHAMALLRLHGTYHSPMHAFTQYENAVKIQATEAAAHHARNVSELF